LKGESLLNVEILWDEVIEQGVVSRTLVQQVRIQATQDPAEVTVNSVVAPWVSLQKAGVVVAEVTKKMDQGHDDQALAALDKTIQELGQYGERATEAIKILQDLKNKISNDEWTLRERKSSRYRSASYLKMSSKEMWSHKSPAPSFKEKPAGSGDQPTAP
jgi:hypothetical protein